jgi:hypothetical protein
MMKFIQKLGRELAFLSLENTKGIEGDYEF